MRQAECLVLLILCSLIALFSCQTLPEIEYRWKNASDGIWHLAENWDPPGIPRSGNHVAVFDHVGSGVYTVTQTLPIIVGQLIVSDSVDLILNSTIGALIDPHAIAPPSIILTGQTIGFPTTVWVEDLSLTTGTVQVTVVNIRTGDSTVINATSGNSIYDYGEFYGEFTSVCYEPDPTSEPEGEINVLPFDVVRAEYMNNIHNTTATTEMTFAFVEPYQERLTWPVVSTSLLSYAAEKTIRKLTNLKQKIVYIMDRLPPYEENDCCPNEEYRYPLNLAPFAERSYQFYAGNIFGPVGCQSLVDYSNRVQLYENELSLGLPQIPPIIVNRTIIATEDQNSLSNEAAAVHQDIEMDRQVLKSLEQKITIKTILQALFGEKISA